MAGLAAAPPKAVTRGDVVDYARALCRQAALLPGTKLVHRRFRAAGLLIDARFSDPDLADLYQARIDCVPAADDAADPDLRVDVLSADTLGWPAPARWADDWSLREFERLFQATDLRVVHPYHPEFWQIYAPAARYGLQLAATRDARPPWDAGAPLRLHLHWALAARNRRLVHGATLGLAGTGIVLVGPGGAGKSSTTLAGLAAGLQTVGDDYVVVDSDPPTARPVFRIGKLDRPGLARLGEVAGALEAEPDNWQGKVEFALDRLFAGAVTRQIALRAILMPKIASVATTAIAPLSAAEAMRELTFANLYQIPCELESGFRFFSALTRRLPAYRLDLSTDAREIGRTLRAFIAGLDGR